MSNEKSGTTISSKCPHCYSGTMLVWKVTPETERLYGAGKGAEFAVPCPYCTGYVEKREAEVKTRAGIPTAFENVKIDNFDWTLYGTDMTKRKDYVRSWLADYKNTKKTGIGFYLYSRTKGTGKTMLACAMANTLMEYHGCVTKYVPSYSLLDVIKNPDKYADRYGDNPMKTLTTCELLIIDDIGQKVSGADWQADVLYQICDERMQNKRVTFFTSNYAINELPYEDRVTSRIYSMTVPMEMPNVDLRQKKAKEDKQAQFAELEKYRNGVIV